MLAVDSRRISATHLLFYRYTGVDDFVAVAASLYFP